MSEVKLNPTDLAARIADSIDASIAAEKAERDLTEGLTVEEAEFCLIAVGDQVLGFDAKRRRESYVYDEDAIRHEIHCWKIMNTLTEALIDLVTMEQRSLGASEQDAESVAHARHRKIFDNYIKKRNAIGDSK